MQPAIMTTKTIPFFLSGSLVLGAGACTTLPGQAGDGDDAPGGGGWTQLHLLDDTTDPNDTLHHAGNDLVTGIHYASDDDGYVVTQGDHDTASDGGAVFKATRTEVTSIAFRGYEGLSILGAVDFVGIEPTDDGYIALAYAADLIASRDGGATFQIEKNGGPEDFGLEAVLAFQESASGATMIRDTGVVTVTAGAPGAGAAYEDVWAPTAVPPVPDPVPADQCQEGPESPQVPVTRASVYVSPDRGFIAYTDEGDGAPQICVSTDGGRAFHPRVLGVTGDAAGFAPTGVLFTSDTDGLAWWGSSLYAAAYVQRTTDGGNTWTPVALPAEVASHAIELRAGFFAPDGEHGWLTGYDYDTSSALLVRTTDGGATWAMSGGDLAAQVSAAGGGKLWSGFALDADHIWVGGERGVLFASDRGGE